MVRANGAWPRFYLAPLTNPPSGMPGVSARPGESPLVLCVFCVLLPSTMEGRFPLRESNEATSTSNSPATIFAAFIAEKTIVKNCGRCLTYSRLWYLSRYKHNRLWPESAKGIELGNSPCFQVNMRRPVPSQEKDSPGPEDSCSREVRDSVPSTRSEFTSFFGDAVDSGT